MPPISYERLSGIVAGAFLFRATDSLLTVVSQLALPVGELSIRFLTAVPSIVAALVGGLIGYGFLLPQRKRWFYLVTIVLLSLGASFSAFGALTPLFLDGKVGEAMLGSMVARGLTQLAISLALIACVFVLMKKGADPVGPPDAGATPRSG
jgi:hypothetical protein